MEAGRRQTGEGKLELEKKQEEDKQAYIWPGKYMPKIWKKWEKTHATTQAVGWKPSPCPMEGARAWPVCLQDCQGHDSLSPANPEAVSGTPLGN